MDQAYQTVGAVADRPAPQPGNVRQRRRAAVVASIQQAQFGNKLHKLGHRLRQVRTIDDLYVSLVTEWNDAEAVVPGAGHVQSLLARRADWPKLEEPVHRMMAVHRSCL